MKMLLPVMLSTLLILAGCAGKNGNPDQSVGTGKDVETRQQAPLARQITASDYCGLTAPGLVYLDSLQALQAFRSLNGQMLSLDSAASLDFQREHLLVVAMGRKNTGGFGLTLADAEMEGSTLAVTARVRTPAPGSMVTQALTTPCVVLAVKADDWNRVVVRGDGLTNMTRTR
ncbi:protease complex subunit PrcB family protein [Marinobacter changyiensis]|uniref:protease complex subunit PrcB family protein n=1 Tax=Marinobacter changyiensis TaxID=2604091 RepID=UPI001264C322|nr:protease complex subunit PrcB family protein [Marinobacter changyiensis]